MPIAPEPEGNDHDGDSSLSASQLSLTIDLRLAPSPVEPGESTIDLRGLLGGLRDPWALQRRLRRVRYGRVVVRRDDRRLSGVQAVAMLLAGAARTTSFVTERDGTESTQGSRAFRARTLTQLAGLLPAELVGTAANWLWAAAIGRASRRAPNGGGPVERLSYVRGEPSLSWAGMQVGGIATHTSGIINGLTSHGIEVRVFAAGVPDELQSASAELVPLRRVYQLVFWLTMFAYSRDLARAGARWRSDLVMQHHALGSYAGLSLARRQRVPLVLLFHGSDLWAEKHWGGRRVALVRTAARLDHRVLSSASLVVVVSDVLREELVRHGIDERRILVNPSGVDVEGFAEVRARNPREWRERLGRAQAPTIGFVGTFALFHGVALLPAMVQAVAAQRPDARWLLIGDGPMRAEVAADVAARGFEDCVDFTGAVLHHAAVEMLASCDVCVSPHVPNPDGSPFFGSPTKLFEYMGLGKAIVASDLGQIGTVLKHERSALLCEPGDPDAAAAGVVRLLDDPELAARLAEAALAEAAEHYSWGAHTQRIVDTLRTGATPD